MVLAIKKIFSSTVWKNTYDVLKKKKIVAYWWRGKENKNWGDKINPLLISWLSGKDVVHVNDIINFRFIPVHTCIGSVIEHLRFKGVHIWGTGIISETSSIRIKPEKIHAVRGPSSLARLMSEGFHCPEIYGDPALLLPKFYAPNVEKTIELGIIPHFKDKENSDIKRLQKEGGVIIDIFGGETEFIDNVCRCKRVVSSSLHGLIVADAYGIPSKWIKVSGKIFGGDFKYGDYYRSIGVKNEGPLIIKRSTTVNDLSQGCWEKEMRIDLDQLLHSCPFYENYQIDEIVVPRKTPDLEVYPY